MIMKELSIEEKAKAYDEALEKSMELLSRCIDNRDRRTKIYRVEDIESIFPELKKSEDEKKTKESLMQYIWDMYHKDFYPPRPSIECCDKWLAWLEKQGEQSDSDVKDYNSIDPHFGKSVDKIKPKFHEGEWITNGDYTWKIVEVKPLDYILQSQDGNIVDDTISHVDEQFHSFTIKDARDGDVLALSYASQNYILIYKGLHEKDFDTMMSVFCSYYVEKDTYDDETDSFHMLNTGEIITPATKEQHDLLFQKMKEAGYEFDFEKKEFKELKKIGQKSAWSEEDEKMLNNIDITFFEEKSIPNVKYWKFMNWLKSLKDRVQSKSQWKPSDEQMDVLETAVSSLQSNTLKSLYQDLMREKNYE